MTNEQIVFNKEQELAKEGKIAYTGRVFVVQMDDGTRKEFKETEPIHTYAVWKQFGMAVRRGEHAVAKFPIWKHTTKQKDDGDEESKMFMKTAHFFSRSQVEEMEVAE